MIGNVCRYEGGYSNGRRNGGGKFTMPNKDTYEGEWVENEVRERNIYDISYWVVGGYIDAWRGDLHIPFLRFLYKVEWDGRRDELNGCLKS